MLSDLQEDVLVIPDQRRDYTEQAMPKGSALELLDFESPNDPDHPRNWPFARRLWATFLLSVFNIVVMGSSSIFSSVQEAVADEFGVSHEVVVLGTPLFLLV